MQLAAALGGSLASSGLGALLGRYSPTPQQQQVTQNDLTAQKTGLQTGQNLIGMGTGAVQQPINYWSSILSGNRGLATSALAPEISQIGQGYAQAGRTSAALMPRGGPSAQVLGDMPYQQQRDVSTLFQQARPAAASALGNLGSGILGQGANALYASTAAGRDVLQQQQFGQQMEAQRGQGIGAGLFSQFQQYGMPALKKQFPNLFNMQSADNGGNV
jgi:hypothetical protein